MEQLRRIKSLGFKATPSIFPPSEMAKNSHLLANNLRHFMVHLPLQSPSAKMNRFQKTLMVYNSEREIKVRVKEIRKLFPKAVFINNHTGSTFTSNYQASKKLYRELINEGFIFLDSRTSSKSKIGKIAKEFHRAYIYRDVFIDNVKNSSYILKQLQKGVKLAKKRGFAVVIGHPHNVTLKTLESREAKRVLRGVKTLYIDEFYNWRFRR